VRLVGPNGEQVGIVRIEDALRLAQEADLDLVEVAATARPPVCKLMDFGKYKYETAQKARESRRNQTNTVIKEMKLRPKIDPHDYETKKGHVVRFLRAGDKVKITIMFRGREQSRPELGFRLLQRLAEDVSELGFVESSPRQDGRNMIMVLGPHKKKSEARVDVEAEMRSGRPNVRPRSRRSAPSAPSRLRHTRPSAPPAPRRSRRVRQTTSTRSDDQLRPLAGCRSPSIQDRVNDRKSGAHTAMPKMKTHSGMKKRVRITGSGKVRREQTGKRHLAEAKPTKRKRRLSGTVEVAPSHVKKAKKLLGI